MLRISVRLDLRIRVPSISRNGQKNESMLLDCRALPSRSAQNLTCGTASQFAILEFQLTVDENILHAIGEACRFGIRGHIFQGSGVEDSYVSKISFFEQATVKQPLTLCGQGSHFTDSLFERKQMQIPDIVPEKTRHGAESARVSVRFVKWSVERRLAGVEAETGPRLLQAVDEIIFVSHEIKCARLSLVGNYEIKECVELRFLLCHCDLGNHLSIKSL